MIRLLHFSFLLLLSVSTNGQVKTLAIDRTTITVFSLDFSKQITNGQLRPQFQEAVMGSIRNICPNMDVRTDFGYNNEKLDQIDKLRLENEIRQLAMDILKERDSDEREDIGKKLRKKTDSNFLFLGTVDYIAHTGVFRLYIEILDLYSLKSAFSEMVEWEQQMKDEMIRLSISSKLMDASLCGYSKGSIDKLPNLREELRSIVRLQIGMPNNNKFNFFLREYVYSNPILFQLYMIEFENVLEQKISNLLPKGNNSKIRKEEKELLRYYINELQRIFEFVLDNYAKTDAELQNMYKYKLNRLKRWQQQVLNLETIEVFKK